MADNFGLFPIQTIVVRDNRSMHNALIVVRNLVRDPHILYRFCFKRIDMSLSGNCGILPIQTILVRMIYDGIATEIYCAFSISNEVNTIMMIKHYIFINPTLGFNNMKNCPVLVLK